MITHEFSARTNRRLGKGLVLVALLLASCAAWRWHVEAQFVHSASLVEGQVVAVLRKQQSAEVEFHDKTGRRHSLQPTVRSAFRSYEVGEKVEVFFQPNNPNRAKLNEVMQLWASTAVCLYLSSISGILGLLVVKGVLVAGPLRQKRLSVGQP